MKTRQDLISLEIVYLSAIKNKEQTSSCLLFKKAISTEILFWQVYLEKTELDHFKVFITIVAYIYIKKIELLINDSIVELKKGMTNRRPKHYMREMTETENWECCSLRMISSILQKWRLLSLKEPYGVFNVWWLMVQVNYVVNAIHTFLLRITRLILKLKNILRKMLRLRTWWPYTFFL